MQKDLPGAAVHLDAWPDSRWRHWQNCQNHPSWMSKLRIEAHHPAVLVTDSSQDLISPLCCQLLLHKPSSHQQQESMFQTLTLSEHITGKQSVSRMCYANLERHNTSAAGHCQYTCLRSVMFSAACSSSSFGFGNSIMIRRPSSLHNVAIDAIALWCSPCSRAQCGKQYEELDWHT